MQRAQEGKAGTGMLAYLINGRMVKVQRCAADMYIIRDIPKVFDNRVAVGAVAHKDLAQKFLDSYAGKLAEKTIDVLDVDFDSSLPTDAYICRGCVFWNGKNCEGVKNGKNQSKGGC